MAALALVGFVVPIAAAHHFGALGIPRGDDWSYLRTLFHWTESGELNFNHWVSMTLLGQLVMSAPLALFRPRAITPIQMLTATLGFAALVMLLNTCRRITHNLWLSLGVALAVAGGPLWGVLTVSYMTDVIAFSISLAAIAVGIRMANAPTISVGRTAAVIALGVWAYSIREYAAIPSIAVVAVTLMRLRSGRCQQSGPTDPDDVERAKRKHDIKLIVVAGAIGLIAIGIEILYWRTIPDAKNFALGLPTTHSVRLLVTKGSGIARLVGLAMTPLLLFFGPVRIVRRALAARKDTTVFFIAFSAVVLGITGASGPRIAFAGNYVVPNGALARGVGRGFRPDVFPPTLWNGLIAIGTIGTVLLGLLALPIAMTIPTRIRQRNFEIRDHATAMLAFATTGYVGIYAAAALVGLPLYDRYALPLMALVGLLVAQCLAMSNTTVDVQIPTELTHKPLDRTTSNRVVGIAAILAMATLGTTYTLDAASYDGARWRVAEATVKAGYSRRDIGGNFMWINYNAVEPSPHWRSGFCVTVTLLKGTKLPVGTIVVGRYRPPFNEPVVIAAVRQRSKCHGANPAFPSAPLTTKT